MKNGVINLKTENLLSQVETVRADLNMNPLGVPESVTKAIADNMSQLSVYPDHNTKKLKEAISAYSGAKADDIIVGGSSYEFVKILCEFTSPKKAILITPGAQNYEKLLSMNGCEIIYYSTPEEEDFTLDIADFISKLSEDIDIIFISNPNGTTSQIIDAESLEFIAKICDGNNITMSLTRNTWILLMIWRVILPFLSHRNTRMLSCCETQRNFLQFPDSGWHI